MLFLTASPDEVLGFLELDKNRYWRVFGRKEEMAVYVAGMRFFRPGVYVRKDLKANDRKRMAQREVYRWFVEEWVPSRIEAEGVSEDVAAGREQVLEEVLNVWGKREEYQRVVAEWRRERKELLGKQQANERRRAGVRADIAYAEAWIQASG